MFSQVMRVLVVALLVAQSGCGSSEHTTPPAECPTLVEQPDCHAPSEAVNQPEPTVATPGTQQITVTVPSITVVTYTDTGQIDTVMTNTGCAPTADNQVWLTNTDGALIEGTWTDIADHDFTGDFTQPGTHVPQAQCPAVASP